ncbi:MAG: hypothetical protein H7A21_01505 [Spirochaetales bacterium]|nr:hypothetical protein [Leptospiraceae bacterium]MCP5480084.1 hypothetical protein [Spirochaetales bacterium]MCP5485575.1 hypothetical protein [Spirochaetales bacterium]
MRTVQNTLIAFARWPRLLSLVALCSLACTNYSSSPQIVNPPIILGIQAEGTGHIITVAAQNTELGFVSYRLFQGIDESAARTQTTGGTDCGPFNILPNDAVQYIIEVKPGQTAVTAGTTDNRLCAMATGLTSGRYVALRSLVFNITSIGTSDPSNAVLVP